MSGFIIFASFRDRKEFMEFTGATAGNVGQFVIVNEEYYKDEEIEIKIKELESTDCTFEEFNSSEEDEPEEEGKDNDIVNEKEEEQEEDNDVDVDVDVDIDIDVDVEEEEEKPDEEEEDEEEDDEEEDEEDEAEEEEDEPEEEEEDEPEEDDKEEEEPEEERKKRLFYEKIENLLENDSENDSEKNSENNSEDWGSDLSDSDEEEDDDSEDEVKIVMRGIADYYFENTKVSFYKFVGPLYPGVGPDGDEYSGYNNTYKFVGNLNSFIQIAEAKRPKKILEKEIILTDLSHDLIINDKKVISSEKYFDNNIAFGFDVLEKNKGIGNLAFGYEVLIDNITGQYNIGIGYQALNNNNDGNYNIAIGYKAGLNSSSDNSISIGNLSGIGNFSNTLCLGSFSVASGDNQIVLGNSGMNILKCGVNTITSISDRRDKKNIKGLEYGTNFLMKLKPVSFEWNMRDLYTPDKYHGLNYENKEEVRRNVEEEVRRKNLRRDGNPKIGHGFIAQEIIALEDSMNIRVPGLTSRSNPERFETGESALIPILVKAFQEQQNMIDILHKKLDEQNIVIYNLQKSLSGTEKKVKWLEQKLEKI